MDNNIALGVMLGLILLQLIVITYYVVDIARAVKSKKADTSAKQFHG